MWHVTSRVWFEIEFFGVIVSAEALAICVFFVIHATMYSLVVALFDGASYDSPGTCLVISRAASATSLTGNLNGVGFTSALVHGDGSVAFAGDFVRLALLAAVFSGGAAFVLNGLVEHVLGS
jgi:hypothetical protein